MLKCVRYTRLQQQQHADWCPEPTRALAAAFTSVYKKKKIKNDKKYSNFYPKKRKKKNYNNKTLSIRVFDARFEREKKT